MPLTSYTLRLSHRARSLRISVYPDGRCVVTAPTFLGQGAIERFVAAKSAWIADKLRSFMPFRPIMPRRNSHAAKAAKASARAEYLKHREAARELVSRRLPELNQAYGFKYGRISIRNQKSRWGSCSIKGNLNFNYKIALLPPHLADYLMVHELCHLGAFDHSAKFWALVAQTLPHYKALRKELTEFGRSGK